MEYCNKTIAFQKKRRQATSSKAFKLKLADVQNTIRIKFKKACKIRLECERNVNQAMKPLTATKICMHQQSSAKIYSLNSIKDSSIETNNLNYLCNRLRVLLDSTNLDDDVQRTHEINAIINRLHDLKILV